MKLRGLIVIDVDIEDVADAAEIADTLRATTKNLERRYGQGVVTWAESALRPRRGDTRPELKTAKLRS